MTRPRTTTAPVARTIRCAIYTRKSSEGGLEQDFNSLDAQRESAEVYIASQKAEGWVALPDRYDDGGFTSGIDARLCRPWFARRLGRMRVQILYTAYDVPGAKPHVERTVKTLRDNGLSQRQVGCYVLVGYEGDTLEHAEARLEWVFQTGGTPFAMFFRPADDPRFTIPKAWRSFVRKWNRPALIFASHEGKEGTDMAESAPAEEARALEEALR